VHQVDVSTYGEKVYIEQLFFTENSFNSKLKITREFGDALGYCWNALNE
jgi:hypothetical protein